MSKIKKSNTKKSDTINVNTCYIINKDGSITYLKDLGFTNVN